MKKTVYDVIILVVSIIDLLIDNVFSGCFNNRLENC